MRYVVIGGSGHIGTYLIPQLVRLGHEVIQVSRGNRAPYIPDPAWREVRTVNVDRSAEEAAGTFGKTIADLQPDVVVDVVCFTRESAVHLVEALEGKVQHFIHVGTIWVHGPSAEVPTSEDTPRRPICEYGRNKLLIEQYLQEKARRDGFPATVVHPGHIVGQGWAPLNPAGHFNPQVFVKLARGEELVLPNFGMETVHHVHAADVGRLIIKAAENWSLAVGQSFHAVSPAAVTLRGYAEAVAGWFGREANLRFEPFDVWRQSVSAEEAAATHEHISRSPSCSIEKGKRLLGYHPRYTSLEAVRESVEWLIEHKVIEI
jgi:nucleoside-diphosphate-sugar epimerase